MRHLLTMKYSRNVDVTTDWWVVEPAGTLGAHYSGILSFLDRS